jgi:hypothetical protein
MTVPLPDGGRCRLSEYWRLSDQPCVGGSEYCRLRALTPATGVDPTAFASASSGLPSTRSICGFFSGTARLKMRVIAPKIPDCPLR